jgi:hypothetical protein
VKIVSYCAKTFAPSARLVTGTEPLTCPPLSATHFDPHALEADFLFIKLHGLKEQPFWYGDDWITALRADQIIQADLSHSVVFVCNCFLPESPMLDALTQAGARWIIGGHGPNYARPDELSGPDLLALTMRRLLAWHIPPDAAFILARKKLRIRKVQDLATRDALQFEVFQS